MVRTKNAPADPRALRRQQIADQAERNRQANEDAATRQKEHDDFRAMSPANQKLELRRRHQANLRAQAERNAAEGTPTPEVPPRRLAGRTPEEQERKPFTPVEETKPRRPVKETKGDTKTDDGLDDVKMTDAARKKARKLGLSAGAFARRKHTAKTGFSVDDVDRIAAAAKA